MILLWSFYVVEPNFFPFFKWQYRAGAGAGAEIKLFWARNTGQIIWFRSAALVFLLILQFF